MDRTVEETVRSYSNLGLPTKWCVGYWTQPPDFGERLATYAFRSWDVRGMIASSTLTFATSSRVIVEEVTPRTLAEFVEADVRGWGIPAKERDAERDVFRRALFALPRRGILHLARLDGAVVGTATTDLQGNCGYLRGGQVVESARGHGVYRALVAARLEYLRRAGIAYAVVQAREATAAPILEKLGFTSLFRSQCFVTQ